MEMQHTEEGQRDRRKEERYPFLKTIRYACVPDTGGDFRGVTIDISKSGMSMYLFNTHSISECLVIEVRDKLPVAFRTGTVRWVQQVDSDLYRAGLQFS